MTLPPSSKHGFPVRRVVAVALIILLALGAWIFTRPKPIAVVLAKVERGTVEATVSNTRAGTITCGTSPAWISAPSRMISSAAPSTKDSLSGAPA